jgi:NadR type nicotinamide-nucleotide adenylyltransferase
MEIAQPKIGVGNTILAAPGEKIFMQKIVLTGPESSGKTTLAKQLAGHFGTVWVPEFARGFLEKLGRPYQEADLLEIAKGQVASEDECAKKNTGPLFLDTSLEVVKIWSEVVFGRCHPLIKEHLHNRLPDLYLLCRPDLPWEPDPLRENPGDRQVLFDLYLHELTGLGVHFIEINGMGKERIEKAIANVNLFLTN